MTSNIEMVMSVRMCVMGDEEVNSLTVWEVLLSNKGNGSGQDEASSHNQKKDNNKFKGGGGTELSENQTVWKLENQGIKKETCIQTGRRGGHRQLGQGGHTARQQREKRAVPHLHVDKPGGTTAEQDRLCNPGFQSGEIKPQSL